MNSILVTFSLVMAVVMAILISSYLTQAELDHITTHKESGESQSREPYRGWSRFLGPKSKHAPYKNPFTGRPRAQLTCDKFPRVCHVKGSPGRDCCRKKCVNVKTDNLNCGMCGMKCRYPETCCNGKCVNPLNDKKNCGGCHNKCQKGSLCYYGMCSYA